MARRALVEPRDDRPLSELAKSVLTDAGWPAPDAEWLATSLMDDRVIPTKEASTSSGDLSDAARWRLEQFARRFKAAPDRNAAVLLGFDEIGVDNHSRDTSQAIPPWQFLRSEAMAFVSVCRAHGIDFTSALVATGHQSKCLTKLAKDMFQSGGIDLERAIDWLKLLELSNEPGWWPRTDASMKVAKEQADRDPTTLVFWLAHAGPEALDAVMPHLERARDEGVDSLVRTAKAIGWSIGTWMRRPRTNGFIHPTSYHTLGPEFASRGARIFAILDEVVGPMPMKHGIPLREAWLRYAWMGFDQQANSMPQDLRGRLYAAAADELGRFRPLFRRAAEPNVRAEFSQLFDLYETCVHFVFDLGTLWQGLKPLLLAFRSLRAQAVATDLRYWQDSEWDDKSASEWVLWSAVPSRIAACIHNISGREQQAGDKDLENARSEFAAWCLERLKTRKKRPNSNEPSEVPEGHAPDLVEPDPNWRECLIRAVRELRVNPGGKGHQILHHVCQHDPDEQVRDAAQIAYAEMRAGWGSAKRISPRTLLLRAFSWIRQGHLLSLGIDPDPVGVQRTRDEERRRTTEPEPDMGV